MKFFFFAFMVISFLGCTTALFNSHASRKQDNLIYFSTKRDELISRESILKSLNILYDGSISKQCDFSFRIFATQDKQKIDTTLFSKNYLASFVIGGDCKGNFRVSLDRTIVKDYVQENVYFVIIPSFFSRQDSGAVRVDNFSFKLID